MQSAGLQSFDDNLWTVIQQQAQRTGKQLSEWGILSPRFLLAGGGLFMTLSNWGLLPQVTPPKQRTRTSAVLKSCI